jgi:nicotinamide mononucleotide transporter
MWEWIAVICGISYVILAMLQKNLCWIFALISSGIYVYLCINTQLYIESTLQFFYVIMAIVGWVTWYQLSRKSAGSTSSNTTKSRKAGVQVLSPQFHIVNIVLSGVGAFLIGLSFDLWTNQANPYIDAFTTVYSLVATYLVVKKVLGNWIYWIVIDLASIFLYADRGYSLTAVLYASFTVLAVIGFFSWRKAYKNQLK